jgi:hypothetical protein
MKLRFDVYDDDKYETNYPIVPRVGEQVDFDIFDKNNERYSVGVVEDVYYTKDLVIIQVKGISES